MQILGSIKSIFIGWTQLLFSIECPTFTRCCVCLSVCLEWFLSYLSGISGAPRTQLSVGDDVGPTFIQTHEMLPPERLTPLTQKDPHSICNITFCTTITRSFLGGAGRIHQVHSHSLRLLIVTWLSAAVSLVCEWHSALGGACHNQSSGSGRDCEGCGEGNSQAGWTSSARG